MDLAAALKPLISGSVDDGAVTLSKFSRDASVFEMMPEVVVSPKTVRDIKKLVEFANKHSKKGVSLTPRAAGTCMSGGSLTQSIVLNMMPHFNKILSIGNDYAVVQPGVYYRDLDKRTRRKQLFLPPYPASRELCAVGGMVGNNAAGERTLCYGATIDYVKSLKVVLSDGNEYLVKPLTKRQLYQKMSKKDFEGRLYRKIHNLLVANESIITKAKPTVSKNSMGYYLWEVIRGDVFDLSKLIVGSQGTLGIITEIEFALERPQPHHALLAISMPSLEGLDQLVNQVLEYSPEAFECFDDQTMHYALKYFSEIVERFNVCSGAQLYLQFLPDFFSMLVSKTPKLVLMADFASDNQELAIETAYQAKSVVDSLGFSSKVIANPALAEKFWVVRRESFRLLKGHAHNMTSAPIIDDVTVNPEKLPAFLPRLESILKQYEGDMIHTLAGHIGSGNFHIIPLMDLNNDRVRDIVPKLMDQVHELTLEFKGSLAGEHNDGLIRGPYLKAMFGNKVYQLFEEVKDIFDPKGIFNPKKKIGVDLDYALQFMHRN